MTDKPGRCETGGCITVTIHTDRVHITETERPDETITTSRSNWDTFTNGIRAQERARIVAWLRTHCDEHPGQSPESRAMREELDWVARKIEHGAVPVGALAADE